MNNLYKNLLALSLIAATNSTQAQNVGIGTTTPTEKLHIVGGARITNLGGVGNALVLTDNTGVLTRTALSGNATDVYTGAGTFVPATSLADDDWTVVGTTMYNNNTGNVGVGITTPNEKFHIVGDLRVSTGEINSETDNLRLMQGVRGDDTAYEWTGWYSGTTRQGIILYDGAWSGANSLTNEFSLSAENGNHLSLNTQGNQNIFLMPKGTGNVGVKTLAPTEELTVNGWIGRTAHDNGGLCGSYNSVGANSTNSNPVYIIGSNYKPAATTLGNMYGIGYSHTNASFVNSTVGSWGMYVAADGDARLWFGASASGVSYFNAGDVGIGLTVPTNKLHVTDNASGVNQSVIYARNTNTGAGVSYGIRGEVNSTAIGSAGVIGLSTNGGQNEIGSAGDYTLWGAGVFGLGWASAYSDMPTSRDFGVYATCNFSTGTGVYGRDRSNAAASYAVYAQGKFAATGTKSASVPTSKGNQLVYCMESPEIWFEDMGVANLVNGEVHLQLEDLFNETVFIDEDHPMHVFLQEQGDCNGLYFVPDEDGKGFTVKEKAGGNSNVKFSYRVMGKRRFYQDHRFGVDSHQPFGNNLETAKYVAPYITDPMEMKAFIASEKLKKEAAYKQSDAYKKEQEAKALDLKIDAAAAAANKKQDDNTTEARK